MNTFAHENQMHAPNIHMVPQPQVFQTISQGQNQNQPRLSYFISRSNATAVPLIPADELPFNVRLQSVPRVLTFDQTIGMQHVGMAPYTGLTFRFEGETTMQGSTGQPSGVTHTRSQSSTGSSKKFQAPDAVARQALLANTNTASNAASRNLLPQRPHSAQGAATNWRKPPTSDPVADKTQAIIDAIVSSEAGAETAARIGYQPKSAMPPPPSGNLPDQDKKEYCTYWIRTGECDYTQQGCLYKHEMPDRATLGKIGFRTVPRWWQERTQAVRMGGERACVGPIVKSAVWLQRKGGGESDADADDESEGEDVRKEAKGSAGARKLVTEDAKKTTTAVASRAPTPLPIKTREKSTSSELINFEPLLPTPPSSTPSLTPGSSVEISPRAETCTLRTPPEHSKSKTTKIFVPAGESPEHHIAEVKTRNARSHSTCARTTNTIEVPALDKQIQDVQKSKPATRLMASMQAPPGGTDTKAERSTTTHKRNAKTGCRPRRPASAPMPANTEATKK